MAVPYERVPVRTLHPINAIFLAATIPLFLGALLSDIAYYRTYEIQWNNFASWLLAGGLVFCALAVVGALFALFGRSPRRGSVTLYFVLVLAAWIIGLLSAFHHARDAWATMPGGLWLTLVATALACAAKWIAFSGLRTGGTP